MLKRLSYTMDETSPVWPGTPALGLTQRRDMRRGDGCNNFLISLFNHTGTHFDAPKHFNDGGLTISELPEEYFQLSGPLVLDIPKGSCEKVTADDLRPHAGEIARCDILLIRTGFSKYRADAPRLYAEAGPQIAPECAKYLAEGFPDLKVLGVDFISVGSASDPESSGETHRALFGGSHFVCAIEDMDLALTVGKRVKKILAVPLFIKRVDSMPVTVLAELE